MVHGIPVNVVMNLPWKPLIIYTKTYIVNYIGLIEMDKIMNVGLMVIAVIVAVYVYDMIVKEE